MFHSYYSQITFHIMAIPHFIFVDNFLKYLWAFLPVFSLLSHFHSNRSQDFLFVSSEESFGSTENRHSSQEFLVFTSKKSRGRTGLEEGGLSTLDYSRDLRDISFVPQSVLGRQCAPKTGMLDSWAWGFQLLKGSSALSLAQKPHKMARPKESTCL